MDWLFDCISTLIIGKVTACRRIRQTNSSQLLLLLSLENIMQTDCEASLNSIEKIESVQDCELEHKIVNFTVKQCTVAQWLAHQADILGFGVRDQRRSWVFNFFIFHIHGIRLTCTKPFNNAHHTNNHNNIFSKLSWYQDTAATEKWWVLDCIVLHEKSQGLGAWRRFKFYIKF